MTRGSITSREYIQRAIDTILSETPSGGIITTEEAYRAVSNRTRTITQKNVSMQMRERPDLKWTSAGKWEKQKCANTA